MTARAPSGEVAPWKGQRYGDGRPRSWFSSLTRFITYLLLTFGMKYLFISALLTVVNCAGMAQSVDEVYLLGLTKDSVESWISRNRKNYELKLKQSISPSRIYNFYNAIDSSKSRLTIWFEDGLCHQIAYEYPYSGFNARALLLDFMKYPGTMHLEDSGTGVEHTLTFKYYSPLQRIDYTWVRFNEDSYPVGQYQKELTAGQIITYETYNSTYSNLDAPLTIYGPIYELPKKTVKKTNPLRKSKGK
jgi:hypothetical protein